MIRKMLKKVHSLSGRHPLATFVIGMIVISCLWLAGTKALTELVISKIH